MRILGVEFGTWSLKAVEMESRFRKLEILEFHEVRLPLGMTEPIPVYQQAIEQLLARLPAHPEKIITALPHNQVALRFLNLPIKKRKKVEQMFRFELEDSIPFKMEESIVEHQVYPTKDGSLVVAALSPKKNIQSFIGWLNAVGIDPDWLCFEGMGMFNLAHTANLQANEEPGTPILLVDMGHSKTNISVMRDGHLEFVRTLGWGGAAINHSIALNLGVSLEEAEQAKINQLRIASGENEDLESSFQQAITPFLADLNHTLIAYRNQNKREIKSIYLTGGSAKLDKMDQFLQESLNIPAQLFSPFDTMEVKADLKQSADPHRFVEAWGRAIALGRKAPILFNFRQQELARQTSLNEISDIFKNPNLVKLLQYGGTLAGILFLHVTVASHLANREESIAKEELKKVFQDTFRTVPAKVRSELIEKPADLKKFIDKKNVELEQKLNMLSRNKTSMLRYVAAVSSAFPKTIRVDVNDLQIDDSKFSLDGVVYDNGDLAPVTEALKKISSFADVTLQQDGQRFTYAGKVIGQK